MRGYDHDNFVRAIPGGSGNDNIGCIKSKDPIGDDGTVGQITRKREMVSMYGGPTNLQRISYQSSATGVATCFPYDGVTTNLPSQTNGATNGNSLLILPTTCLDAITAGFQNISPIGLAVAVLNGSTLMVRSITGTNNGLTVTVNRPWSTAQDGAYPQAGNWFGLFMDIRWMQRIHIVGDINNSATPNPQIVPILFDWGMDGSGTSSPSRKPLPIPDAVRAMGNLGAGMPNLPDANRYSLQTITIDSRGAAFMKVFTNALNGAVSLSLYAGVS